MWSAAAQLRPPKHSRLGEAVPSLSSPLPERQGTKIFEHVRTHTETQRKHKETYMANDDKAISVGQVSGVAARNLGGKSRLHWMMGMFMCALASPPMALSSSPFGSQLTKHLTPLLS